MTASKPPNSPDTRRNARASRNLLLLSAFGVLKLAFSAFSWHRRRELRGEASERGSVEEVLRGDEEQLRSPFQHGSDIFTILEADGTIRYESPSIERVLGYKPEDLIGKDAFDYVHPEDLERVLAVFAEGLAERGATRRVEFRFRHADGSWRHLESIGNNLLDDPSARGVIVTSRDITERKRAEETLKESEECYRAVVEQSMDGIYLFDADTKRILETNPSLQKMFGYSAEEFRGMELYELIAHPPEDVDSNVRRTLKERQRFIGERRYRRKDGSLMDVEVGVNAIFYGGKEVICAVVRDATERKEAERSLREAATRYRTLVEQIPVVTYIEELRDNGKVLTYVSPQYEIMLGYSLKEGASHQDQWLQIIHPEDRERVLAEDARTDETLEPFEAEYRVFARDGRVVWVRDEALLVRDEEDRPLFWQGVMIDITEQKRAEKALIESELRLRTVITNVPVVLFTLDHTGTFTLSEGKGLEALGLKPGEAVGRSVSELYGDKPEILGDVDRALAGEEFSALREVGSRTFEMWYSPLRAGTGEVFGAIGVATDITERRRTERALRESEHRFRQLFEQSVDALFVHDEKGRFVDCNSQACHLLGYTREELLDLSMKDISCNMPSEEERALKESEGGTLWQRALAGAPGTFAFSHEEENRRKDGTTFPVEVRVGSVDYGGRRMILTSTRDITERKRAEETLKESEELHRRQARELSLLYQVSTAVAQELDLSVVFRTVVEAVAQTFGYTLVSAYLLEGEVLVLQHQVGFDRVIERIPITEGVTGRVARTGRPVLLEDVQEDPASLDAVEGITSEICVPLFDRSEVAGVLTVESTDGVVLTEADLRLVSALAEQVGGAIGRARLYTQVRENEARLTYRAFHDPLTGLANRALFLDRLKHAQVRAKRQKGKLAVLFMDLDNFKVINDSLGHGLGDRLLVTVAERLRTCVRPQDTIARLGGDEFVALLEDLDHASAAVRVAERIMEELQVPFDLDGHKLHTSASIGIALSAASGGDLLRAADTAMYSVKESGKGRYEVFKEAMHDRALERLRLENDLRVALEREELAVYYQPKLELRTTRVVGVEALLRWQHPMYGLLSPRDFMPLAEQTGLIVPIGRWVLLETCRQARVWQERCPGCASLLACVNLSVKQLRQTDFISEALSKTGLDPGTLVIEITEDAVMEDAQSAISVLEKLKSSGIKLAIDDFGTGYSSLSYLRRLPVDFLKIDRSFVERLDDDPRSAEIVSGTISLAHTLELKTTAEGVETAAQLERLKEMGCDLAQGNYFSEPLIAVDMGRYLERD